MALRFSTMERFVAALAMYKAAWKKWPTRHIFPVEPSASFSHVQHWVTTTSWPERDEERDVWSGVSFRPRLAGSRGLEPQMLPPAPRPVHPGQVGLFPCNWYPVSSCPKGRTVRLVVLEVALITTEVRERGFGSYRACVKGTGISSSCPSSMLLWHVFWFLQFWPWLV